LLGVVASKMSATNRYIRPLLLLLLTVGRCNLSTSSTIRNKAIFSPVKELAPSLAASVAGGTVIAVRCRSPRPVDEISKSTSGVAECEDGDDDIVILFRSPDVSRKIANEADGGAHNLTVTSVYGSVHCSSTNVESHEIKQYSDHSPLYNGPLSHPCLQSNNNARILHAPTGLLVATTGFKPDTSHILQIAAARVLSRNSIYDPNSKSVDPHKLVREDLSSVLIDASSSDGGRPMGVQCLVVGQSCIKRDTMELYTVDPSGGWRSHVGNAVIGRGAERVRSSLAQHKNSATSASVGDETRGWKLALERAMLACADVFDVDEDTDAVNDEGYNSYGAIVVFGSQRSSQMASRCAVIRSGLVMDSYKRSVDRVLREKRTVSVNK
jgi:20S proteasome alpha/beta subunit